MKNGAAVVLLETVFAYWREQRLELLRAVQARYLAGREEAVDELEEARIDDLMVLDEQYDLLGFDAGHLQDALEVVAELLDAVGAVDLGREDLHVVHAARDGERRATPDARSAAQEQRAAGRRQHAIEAADVLQQLVERQRADLVVLRIFLLLLLI